MSHCPLCGCLVASTENQFCSDCNRDPEKIGLFLKLQEKEKPQRVPDNPLAQFKASHCNNCESHCSNDLSTIACLLASLLEATAK